MSRVVGIGRENVIALKGEAAANRAQFLGGLQRKLIIIDESSFLSTDHFSAMHDAGASSRLAA